jgi:hypothetical protein
LTFESIVSRKKVVAPVARKLLLMPNWPEPDWLGPGQSPLSRIALTPGAKRDCGMMLFSNFVRPVPLGLPVSGS